MDINYNSGAAYVFVRQGTNWFQQAYLKASHSGQFDVFGVSVAVSGDTIAVATGNEGSDAKGINGDETNNGAPNSGAAYVFARSGTNWNQQAYLKASNAEAGDAFGGGSVSLSGNTLVVSAVGESSNATGINGNQNDNSATNSGAAYVFTALGGGPCVTINNDHSGGYFIRCSAIADLTYRLEWASSVTGPWMTNATLKAFVTGTVEFHDSNAPPGHAFYRVAQE